MSIRRKLALVLCAAAVAVLLAGGAAYASVTEMLVLQRRAEASYEELTLYATLANDTNRFVREMLAYGNDATVSQLGELGELVSMDLLAIEHVSGPRRLTGPTEAAQQAQDKLERLRALRDGFARILTNADRVSGSVPLPAAERHTALVMISEQDYQARFYPHLATAMRSARRDVESNVREAEDFATTIKLTAAVASGGGLLIVIFLIGGLLGSLDRGIAALLAGSRRLSTGDLQFRLPKDGAPEFQRLSAAFNDMAQSLADAQDSRLRVEKLAAIGELAASVGHDLRNPLGAIRNAVHYLKRRINGTALGADARVIQFIGLIEKELSSSAKIIGALLDFARERPLAVAACPLRPLVEDALSVIQCPAHVQVENKVPEVLPIPDLDRDQFRQVLVNLIQNAVEAIPAERAGRVEVDAQATPAGVSMSITDNGMGIPEKDLARIFEPLFSTKVKGTGLGLAICAGIVRRHGGTLEVKSNVSVGTTFFLQLKPGATAVGPPVAS